MARLLVFRGDSLEREVDLGVRPLRIGRSTGNNDVVLTDPNKAVSRSHAELRYEDGQYVLMDAGSQNGILVDGNRVERVVMYPNVTAMLGPFRLIVDPRTSRSAERAPDEGTLPDVSGVSERVQYAENAVDEEPAADDDYDVESGRGRHRPVAQRSQGLRGKTAALALAGAVALVAGGAGLAMYLRQPAKPSPDEVVAQHITEAKVLLDNNEPQRAITDHLDPALALDPENPELQDLKGRAEAMLIAIDLPKSPLPETPPPPPRLPRPDSSGRGPALTPGTVPADRTGVPPTIQNAERERQQKDFDDASAALARGEFARARQLLLALTNTTGPLADAARAKLEELQRRRKDAAMAVYKEAQQFEADQRWKQAVEAFQRAHQIDESVAVDADIARITTKRLQLAEAKLKDADRLYKTQRDADALQLYLEILDLLPESDSRSELVRKRIAELRK